jgi:hypothetical protein
VDDEQEKKFNYKEVTKKLASEIKELQRKILKTEELIFAATKELNLLNGELLAATGQKAQQVAISIAEKSRRIEDSETILLTHMESLDEKEKELLSLKDN